MKKSRILSLFLLLLLFLNTIPRVFAATTTIKIADDGISGCEASKLTNEVTVQFAKMFGPGGDDVKISTTYLVSLSAQDAVSLQCSTTYALTKNKYSFLNTGVTAFAPWAIGTSKTVSDFEAGISVTETELKEKGYTGFKSECNYYYIAFKPSTTAFAVLIQEEKGDVLTDKQKEPLTSLLKSVTGENEANWYQTGDRYNGNGYNSSGFWAAFTAKDGPREQAQKALASAKSPGNIEAARAALQAEIDKLIPRSQLNATYLYETLQQSYQSFPDDYLDKAFTVPSVKAYRKARSDAQAYLDKLFTNGTPTSVNVVANQTTANGYADALKKCEVVGKDAVEDSKVNKRTIQSLAKVYNMTENNGQYTESSWNAFVTAREKAVDYAAKHPCDEYMERGQSSEYSDLTRKFLDAAYKLTPAGETVKVTFSFNDDLHLRFPDMVKERKYTYVNGMPVRQDPTQEPIEDWPQCVTVELPAGSTLENLWNKTDRKPGTGGIAQSYDSVWKTFVKGRMLYGATPGQQQYYGDSNYVLKNGDEIQLVHMDFPSFTFNYIYRDEVKWTEMSTMLGALHFKETGAQTAAAGTETTLTVERTSAHLWSWDGEYTPYEGATLAAYGPQNPDGTYPDKPILSETTSDANGSVTFKLYQEGEYIVTAYDARPNDEANSVYYSGTASAPYLTLTVDAAEDPDAVNAELKAELDKVYNAYPKKIFGAEAWNTIETAYNTALAVLNDPDATTGRAYLAQKEAIRVIQATQAETLQANKTAIETFRKYLNQLPDNPELITASVKQAAQNLVDCFENRMNDYQKSLVTNAEKAKYDKIKAYLDKIGETWPTAKKYKLELKVEADTSEATAALENMIADLRNNPAKMDRAQGGMYDHDRAIHIVTPYTFGTYAGEKIMLFSETYTEADPLTPVRLYTNVDYAAYFQTRNAGGTYTKDSAAWSINDENLRIVQTQIQTKEQVGVYKAAGLTVMIDGTAYEIKSITYDGLSKSDVVSGTQRVYDDSGYKGKDDETVNVDFSDAYIGFAMPYNDVTVTITWGRVDGTDDEIKAERANALKILEAEYAKYKDNENYSTTIKAAYDKGVAEIENAASVAEIRSARASAVTAMMKAAAGTDASYGDKIEGWGADETDPFDAGRRVGSVTVIMENSTCDGSTLKDPNAQEAAKFFYNNGKPFLTKKGYPLGQHDSVMTVILRALSEDEYSWNGTGGRDFGITYLASVTKNEYTLAEFTCGASSGWMCTLNDFFCNRSLSEFRVSATDPNYSLSDGDVIHVMYTTNGLGSDLGGSWYNSNTTLESLGVEGGELTSAFASGEAGGSYDYTLLIDGDSANITLTPTAANKNYLVRTYLNVKDIGAAEGPGLYKRTESIPVAAGDVIYVGCGEYSWPSMNNQGDENRAYSGTWYALHIVSKSTGGEDVKAQIDALPDSLTYGDYQSYERNITAARAAYKALNNDEAREKVTNLDKLDKLEEQLRSYQDIDDFKQRLAALPEDNHVTLDHKEAVDKVSRIYDYLTPEQKQYLTPAELQKLQELQAKIDALTAQTVIDMITALGDPNQVTLEQENDVKAARAAYDALTKEQKDLVGSDNLAKLEKAEARIEDLKKPDPITPVVPVKPSKPKDDKPTTGSSFTDVPAGSWYEDAVNYVYEKGLMNGTSSNAFSPNANTTRGMIVTILARVEGVNTNGTPWYAAGQKWAMDNGISDGTNMPGVITREQLATILYRYAKQKGYDVSKSAALTAFSDADKVSGYAAEAMQWAVAEGLLQGSNGKLNPQGSATRAQVATILMRFMEKIAK